LNKIHHYSNHTHTMSAKFAIIVIDGTVQSVVSLTGEEQHYFLIDEDSLEVAAEEHGELEDFSMKQAITEHLESGNAEMVTDAHLPDDNIQELINTLYNEKS